MNVKEEVGLHMEVQWIRLAVDRGQAMGYSVHGNDPPSSSRNIPGYVRGAFKV